MSNSVINTQLARIVAPSLSNGNFSQGMEDVFRNINDNFIKIASLPFIQGVQGDSYKLVEKDVWISEKNSNGITQWKLTKAGAILLNSIFAQNIVSFNEGMTFYQCREKLKSLNFTLDKKTISPLDSFVGTDNGTEISFPICDKSGLKGENTIKNNNNLYFYSIINDAGEEENTYLGQYYYFVDGRLRFLGELYRNTESDEALNTFFDYTSFYKYIPKTETSEEKYESISILPSLYYDKDKNDICWKFNGNNTGISAIGPKGLNGKDATFTIVYVDESKIQENATASSDICGFYDIENHKPNFNMANKEIENSFCLIQFIKDRSEGSYTYGDSAFGEVRKNVVYWDPNLKIGNIFNNKNITEYFCNMGVGSSEEIALPPAYLAIPAYIDRSTTTDGNSEYNFGHVFRADTGNTGDLVIQKISNAFDSYGNQGVTGSTFSDLADGFYLGSSGVKGNLIISNYDVKIGGTEGSNSGQMKITPNSITLPNGSLFDTSGAYINGNVGITGIKTNITSDNFDIKVNQLGIHGGTGLITITGATTIINSNVSAEGGLTVRGTTQKSNIFYGPNNPGNSEISDFGNVDNNGYPLVIKSKNRIGFTFVSGTTYGVYDDTADCMIFGNADIYAMKKSGSTYTAATLYLQDRADFNGDTVIGGKLSVGKTYNLGLDVKGPVGITGSVNITGATTKINSNVGIKGNVNITGSVTNINSTTTNITGTTTNIKSNVGITGSVSITGSTTNIKSNVGITGSVSITGTKTEINSTTTNIKGTTTNITGNVGVTGSVSITGTTTKINSNVSINGVLNVRGTTTKSNIFYGPNNPGNGEYPDFGNNVDNNGYPLVIKSRDNGVDSANCMVFGNADIYALKKIGSTYAPNDLCLQHRTGITGNVRIGSKLIVSDNYPGGLEVKDSANILYDLRFGSTNSPGSNLTHTIGVIGQSGNVYGHSGTTLNIYSENLNVLTGSNKNTIVFGQKSGATSTTITAIGSVGIDTAYDYSLAAGQTGTIKDYVNSTEGNLICGAKKNLKLNPGNGRYLSVYNRRSLQGAYQEGTTSSQEYYPVDFYINPYGGKVIIGNKNITGNTGKVTINPDVEIKNKLTGTTGDFDGVKAKSMFAQNARIEGNKSGFWKLSRDNATVFNSQRPGLGYSPVVAVQGDTGVFSLGTINNDFYIAHLYDTNLGLTGATNAPSGKVKITHEGRLYATKLHSAEEALGSVNSVSDVVLGCPIGTIVMWPTTSAPSGWLSCNGARIPCTKSGSKYTAKTGYEKYQKLIDVLGAQDDTNSGGVGGTRLFSTAPSTGTLQTIDGNWFTKGDTFICIPDFKFRFPFGTNGNLDSGDNPGIFKTGGEKEHTLTIDEIPSHDHDFTVYTTGSGGYLKLGYTDRDQTTPKTRTVSKTGGGNAHNNMPPYIAINFIIKYQ